MCVQHFLLLISISETNGHQFLALVTAAWPAPLAMRCLRSPCLPACLPICLMLH